MFARMNWFCSVLSADSETLEVHGVVFKSFADTC